VGYNTLKRLQTYIGFGMDNPSPAIINFILNLSYDHFSHKGGTIINTDYKYFTRVKYRYTLQKWFLSKDLCKLIQ